MFVEVRIYLSLSFLASEKHYESVCYLRKWKMTHIVLLSRSILPQPHRKSFFGAKITNLYAERFILSVFCRLVQKKSPDAGIMCRQCPEIFLNIRTKSRSFCTNIRVNFLMFTSTFQLFFPSGCLFGSPCLRKAASESLTRFLPAPRRDRPRVLSGSSCA